VDSCDRDTLGALAEALDGLASAGFELPSSGLDRYARAMQDVAEADVGSVPTDSPEAAMRYVVLGTVLMEPVLLAMRRVAQQSASLQRFGAGGLSREATRPGRG
jgi:hypothetical protein